MSRAADFFERPMERESEHRRCSAKAMHPSSFDANGYELVSRVITKTHCDEILASLHASLETSSGDSLGTRRLLEHAWCREVAAQLQSHPLIAQHLPADCIAAQCTLFEKSSATNWLVPLHQDLSIPVAERIEHPELTGWSIKESTHYVQPPVAMLEQLVAVRLHLDDCSAIDGPLRVVPQSHGHGRLTSDQSCALRDSLGEVFCTASAGDALLMRPLLLHASSKSTGSSRRRVLHFLYGPANLPLGLAWK